MPRTRSLALALLVGLLAAVLGAGTASAQAAEPTMRPGLWRREGASSKVPDVRFTYLPLSGGLWTGIANQQRCLGAGATIFSVRDLGGGLLLGSEYLCDEARQVEVQLRLDDDGTRFVRAGSEEAWSLVGADGGEPLHAGLWQPAGPTSLPVVRLTRAADGLWTASAQDDTCGAPGQAVLQLRRNPGQRTYAGTQVDCDAPGLPSVPVTYLVNAATRRLTLQGGTRTWDFIGDDGAELLTAGVWRPDSLGSAFPPVRFEHGADDRWTALPEGGTPCLPAGGPIFSVSQVAGQPATYSGTRLACDRNGATEPVTLEVSPNGRRLARLGSDETWSWQGDDRADPLTAGLWKPLAAPAGYPVIRLARDADGLWTGIAESASCGGPGNQVVQLRQAADQPNTFRGTQLACQGDARPLPVELRVSRDGTLLVQPGDAGSWRLIERF